MCDCDECDNGCAKPAKPDPLDQHEDLVQMVVYWVAVVSGSALAYMLWVVW